MTKTREEMLAKEVAALIFRATVDRVSKRVRGHVYQRLEHKLCPEVSVSGRRIHDRTFRAINRHLTRIWWRIPDGVRMSE